MTVLRSWIIVGDDDKTYTVQERARAGDTHHPVDGAPVTFMGAPEYVLANGADVLDGTPGYWKTLQGVLLKKPADL
jgi:hypothetical protein